MSGPDAVPSDKEHLIARNFGPEGAMDGNSFNFLFRACRDCNARKADVERHVSSVTLVNSPSLQTNPAAAAAAERKAINDFHPSKPGTPIGQSHDEFGIQGKFGPMAVNFGMVGPPQLHAPFVEELAFRHIQGLFSLVTSPDYRSRTGLSLLRTECFQLFGSYGHGDWGNPQLQEIVSRTRQWKCVVNISTTNGYCRATMRQGAEGWFWALEWNQYLRVVGSIAPNALSQFKGLPELRWFPVPGGRIREEVPLALEDDLLFSGAVENSIFLVGTRTADAVGVGVCCG